MYVVFSNFCGVLKYLRCLCVSQLFYVSYVGCTYLKFIFHSQNASVVETTVKSWPSFVVVWLLKTQHKRPKWWMISQNVFFFLFLNLYVCILHQCDCIFLKIYAILKTKQHLVPLEEVRKRRKYSDSQRNNEAIEKQKEREKLKETKISAVWLCLSCKYRCLLNDVVQITRAAMFTRIYRPQNRLYRQSMCHFKDFGWFHLNHNDKITIIFSVSILFLSHKKKSEKKKNISQLWITPKSSSLKGFTAKVAS